MIPLILLVPHGVLLSSRLTSRLALLLMVATARVIYVSVEQPRSSLMTEYDEICLAAQSIGAWVPWRTVGLPLVCSHIMYP